MFRHKSLRTGFGRWILSVLILGLVIQPGCDDDSKDGNDSLFEVRTLGADINSDNAVLITGEIRKDTNSLIVAEYGFLYDTTSKLTEKSIKFKVGDTLTAGLYSAELPDLHPNRVYYAKAYVKYKKSLYSGDRISFTTYKFPLTTKTPFEVDIFSAKSGGIIDTAGNPVINCYGLCWSVNASPTLKDSHVAVNGSVGDFTLEMTSLEHSTDYFVKAFAVSSGDTLYGNERTFRTSGSIPIVMLDSARRTGSNSAIAYASIYAPEKTNILYKGFCWDFDSLPTVYSNLSNDGSGTAPYNHNLTGLPTGRKCYIRAYAVNAAGVHYSDTLSFNTFIAPIVMTDTTFTYLSATSIQSGGYVTFAGGTTAFRGVCWSTSPDPTILDAHTTDGTGTGKYYSSVSGLAHETLYYLRAYATNEIGTAYGNPITFKSGGSPLVRTITVPSNPSPILTVGGTIDYDGGYALIQKGICWGLQSDPSVSDQHVTVNVNDPFVVPLRGLNPGVTYHIRAYSVNSYGVGYGEDVSFMTGDSNFTDTRDGQTYKIVTIGDQTWMAENFNYRIDTIYSPFYNNDSISYHQYGRFYTIGTASSRAPVGYHLPSREEWTQLINNCGGLNVAFPYLLQGGMTGLNLIKSGAYLDWSFLGMNQYAILWTSTSYWYGWPAYYYVAVKLENNMISFPQYPLLSDETYKINVRYIKN